MNNYEYPLTSEQKRLWIEWKISPLSAAYNNFLVYKLKRRLNIPFFIESIKKSAWDDVFNIVFFEKEGVPFQKILEKKEVGVDYIELSFDQKTQTYIENLIRKPFNLEEPYPYRFLIIKPASENVHYFVLVMHHILNDGNFMNLFFNRISSYYNKDSKNNLRSSIDFRDYLSECSSFTKGSKDDLLYWVEKLKCHFPTLDILGSHLSTEQANNSQRILIAHNLVNDLRKIAFKNKSTLFLLLMSAINVLISRYYSTRQLMLLYTANNRPLEYKNTMGFFVSTLPMLVYLEKDVIFSDFLKKITDQRKQDKKHQNVSLLDIFNTVRHSLGEINSNHYIIFSKTNFFAKNFSLRDVDIETVAENYKYESSGNLSFLYDEDKDGNLHFLINYNKNLFEDWFMSQMLSHFKIILENIAKNAQKKCGDISCMDPKEIEDRTRKNISITENHIFFHKKVEEYAIATPEKIAVIDEKKSISYEELNKRTNQLSWFLHKKGVCAKDFIGIVADRTITTIIAILSVLKLGAAYVPMDSRSPQKRIDYILKDWGSRYLLVPDTDQKTIDIAKEIKIFHLSEIEPDLNREPDHSLDTNISLNDIMYVIYTSGTTGLPKGVPVTHRNLLSLLEASQPSFNFNANDVWTLFHSLAFDFSVWEFCGALNYGGKLAIVPYSISRDPDKFYQFTLDHGVTILNQTPSAFYEFIESDKKKNGNLSLRHIILGGEKVEYRFLLPWVERHGYKQPTLYNMYGITEGTIHVTLHKINDQFKDNLKNSWIGKPLPHMQTYVLNEEHEIMPFGCPGELHIAGLGLTSGYINNPTETKKRFVEKKFSPNKTAQLLYATGDCVKELPSHRLVYLGRVDSQINFKGFRIEPTEIEYQLDLYPKVKQSAVSLKKGKNEVLELAAYILTKNNERIEPFELRQYLLNFLPTHMIPTKFFQIKNIPLTINGKIDYEALSGLENHELTDSYSFSGDFNSIELLVSEVWRKVLGVNAVDHNKNFFDSGGDSLLLLKVHNELQKVFKFKFQPAILFSYPSILTLSQYFFRHLFSKNIKESNESESRAAKRSNALNKRKRSLT